MRSNVECRRCGCGAIVGLRESCAKCVAAQRARLHASGVGRAERHGASYDNGQLVDNRGKVRGYDEVAMFDAGKYEALIAACDKRIARLASTEPPKPLPPTTVPVVRPEFRRIYHGTWEDGSPVHTNACGMPSRTPEPPAIGEVVSWGVAKADMQARPEAMYEAKYGVLVASLCRWKHELQYQCTPGLWANACQPSQYLGECSWTRVA